jgi:MoaA/NifB/PqqE/SkfB family radical SAM enzyme
MSYSATFLEWEITSACNASCPQCPRNYYGGKTWHSLPIVQVDRKWAEQHLSIEFIESLTHIDFCGTYGDPIMNNNLIDIVEWLQSVNPSVYITIKTNGGIRNANWWAKLGSILNGAVYFALDGLADTNHLYRRGVNFDDVIVNARAFMAAGGTAHWAYIVFKHNQHQVEEARELAANLGFSDFNVKLTSRFFDKKHVLTDSLEVNDANPYTISIPDNSIYVNNSYQKINFVGKDYAATVTINCKFKQLKRVYLSAEGYVFPCGWLHDRMYGFEAEQHPDHERLITLFDIAGGKEMANVNHTPIDQIVHGKWFETLEASWTNDSRLHRCGMMCGEKVDIIKDQNKHIRFDS